MMQLKHNYDVVVVGGDNAALVSALSAHENGARVAILESAHPRKSAEATAGLLGQYFVLYTMAKKISSLYFILRIERTCRESSPPPLIY